MFCSSQGCIRASDILQVESPMLCANCLPSWLAGAIAKVAQFEFVTLSQFSAIFVQARVDFAVGKPQTWILALTFPNTFSLYTYLPSWASLSPSTHCLVTLWPFASPYSAFTFCPSGFDIPGTLSFGAAPPFATHREITRQLAHTSLLIFLANRVESEYTAFSLAIAPASNATEWVVGLPVLAHTSCSTTPQALAYSLLTTVSNTSWRWINRTRYRNIRTIGVGGTAINLTNAHLVVVSLDAFSYAPTPACWYFLATRPQFPILAYAVGLVVFKVVFTNATSSTVVSRARIAKAVWILSSIVAETVPNPIELGRIGIPNTRCWLLLAGRRQTIRTGAFPISIPMTHFVTIFTWIFRTVWL